MGLKRRLKKKNGSMSSIRFDCIIHVQEIRPWPPSQPPATLRSFFLRWKDGEDNSGSLGPVFFSVGPEVGDGKIVFGESIDLSTALSFDVSAKDEYQFQKTSLKMYLFEGRDDQTEKAHLLGKFVMDLSEYGIIRNPVTLCIPMKWKKGSKNSVQPVLMGKIEPFAGENHRRHLLKESLSWKQPLTTTTVDTKELAALMREVYSEEEVDNISLTDDDISSRSSLFFSSPVVETPESSPYRSCVMELRKAQEQDVHMKTSVVADYMNDVEQRERLDFKIEELEHVPIAESASEIAKPLNQIGNPEPSSGVAQSRTLSNMLASEGKNTNKEMVGIVEDGQAYSKSLLGDKRRSNGGSKSFVAKAKSIFKETDKSHADGRIRLLEQKIELLEGELKASASLEASIYSVLADHGRSVHKFHAPARRLSRFYLHARNLWSNKRAASAARSILSGLLFVAKAAGDDVPRLTFWLSNTVVLRALVSLALSELAPASAESCGKLNGFKTKTDPKSSPSSWKDSIHLGGKKDNPSFECSSDWANPHSFTTALEKIEAWIFTRVVKSLWWQTWTPQMQSVEGKEYQKKTSFQLKKSKGKKSSLGNQEQCNFSINIWKKAFRDVCEKVCPVRAAGHDCGCLPILGKLILEECISRLDVVMFNAILRESNREIPTDPLSDPINNSKVLPVPIGRTSFGSGALLKNAIGGWSQWLVDYFGTNADGTSNHTEVENVEDSMTSGFTFFRLLNALSDLLMLPKNMLFDRSIRKEVCPIFGAQVLKRILETFVPDEFFPDPVPETLLYLLDSEESKEVGDQRLIKKFPCDAFPISYNPPSPAFVNGLIGKSGSQTKLKRSASFLLSKGQSSDEELEELESLLSSIIIDSRQLSSSEEKDVNNLDKPARFALLHDVWEK